MPRKPNYKFERMERERAKAERKAERRKARAERKSALTGDDSVADEDGDAAGSAAAMPALDD